MLANNVSEDEDVIIEGSALHTHLNDVGFTDFESIPLARVKYNTQRISIFTKIWSVFDSIFKKASTSIFGNLQKNEFAQRYFQTILKSKVLLDDHALAISEYLQEFSNVSSKAILQKYSLVLSVTGLTSLVLCRYNQTFAGTFFTATILFMGHSQYLYKNINENLNSFILLQNELHDLCKKDLNILKNVFNMGLGQGKTNTKFHTLSANKLQYLQPLIEKLVRYLEITSSKYCKISAMIAVLLPSSVTKELLVTKLNDKSLNDLINGELDYQTMKQLYNTYILMQSEVLYLLATLYKNISTQPKLHKISENILNRIITLLNEFLIKYKMELSKVIEDYSHCQGKMVHYQYRGITGSKWQDVYLHLSLICNKIQLAYNHLESMLADIDANINQNLEEENLFDIIMNKMNEAQKQIDTARNFAEFSTLLIAKTKITIVEPKNSIQNLLKPEETSDSHITEHNTEPEIVDEVFEEYIKDEYIKPLYETNEEGLLEQEQLDKLLAKNFMSELKEALVDKQRSMSERESIALKRMYKNIMKDSNLSIELNNSGLSIPTPPPMPNLINTAVNTFIENKTKDKFNICNDTVIKNNEKSIKNYESYGDEDDKYENNDLLFSTLQLAMKLPPSFKVEEETFVGSGENSEEEIEDDCIDNTTDQDH